MILKGIEARPVVLVNGITEDNGTTLRWRSRKSLGPTNSSLGGLGLSCGWIKRMCPPFSDNGMMMSSATNRFAMPIDLLVFRVSRRGYHKI